MLNLTRKQYKNISSFANAVDIFLFIEFKLCITFKKFVTKTIKKIINK